MEKYHSIQAVAEKLSVSESTVRRWITSGKLTSVRAGGQIRIAQSSIDTFLNLKTNKDNE